MKVSAVMHRSVITATEDMSLKEAGRLIFSLNLAGLPVVKGKKLVGVITEQVILSKMHPTIEDLIEDYVHAKNFDSMMKNIHSVLEASVGEVMNPHVTTISPDAPLMQAHSLMQLNKFSRLPVVNTKNELLGVISQGDIFRAILKEEMPQVEKERYVGFMSRYYDQTVDWKKRFGAELPALFKLFEKENVKKILDVGTWTGEYAIEMAKRSDYSILGLDNNPAMIKVSNEKRAKLPKSVRDRISFILTDYENLDSLGKGKFDAVLCMGNSLPYIPVDLSNLCQNLTKIISDKAVVIIQLLNFEKIMSSKKRLLNFTTHEAKHKDGKKERLFIEFFDYKNKLSLLRNTIIFDYDGVNWIYKGITTTEIKNIKKENLREAFRKAGFKNISFSEGTDGDQGEYGELSFEKPFDPLKSDWLTVIAVR